MDKNNDNIIIDTDFEENNEEYTTIIESYRCSTSPYNHQGRYSLNSSNTFPITPPPKSQIFNFKKNSSDDSKISIEKSTFRKSSKISIEISDFWIFTKISF